MEQRQLFDAGEVIPHSFGANATPAPVGSGPAGETCGSCRWLVRREYREKRYLKCGLVEESRGAGTDIRAKWAACRQWQPRPAE